MMKKIAYTGKALSYKLAGSGPAVVLIHGFGEDSNVWQNQIDFLQDSFRLIVPDLPGSGDSDLIDDMSMEGMAESVHFILQQEGISLCTMIGHSMGGYVALAFAEKNPRLLKGLGLFHSTAFADTEEKKNARNKGIEDIGEKGSLFFLKNFISTLYSSSTKNGHPSIIDDHLENCSYFSKQALIAYYQAMIDRPDRTQVLKQNKLPVLFVLGKHDTAVPFQDGLKLASMPDIVYIHVLENSGHMGMLEEPELSNEILKDFLLKTNK